MKSVEVFGTAKIPVTIDPLNITTSLLNEVKRGRWGWIEEVDGSYFVKEEVGKMANRVAEISKEEYEYYQY